MLFDLIRRYRTIIVRHSVIRFRVYDGAHELIVAFALTDGSTLSVRDYLFLSGERKYAFHWQDRHGALRLRWDNAAHWRAIGTFPHHLHRGTINNVEASAVRNLPQAFAVIARQLQRKKK